MGMSTIHVNRACLVGLSRKIAEFGSKNYRPCLSPLPGTMTADNTKSFNFTYDADRHFGRSPFDDCGTPVEILGIGDSAYAQFGLQITDISGVWDSVSRVVIAHDSGDGNTGCVVELSKKPEGESGFVFIVSPSLEHGERATYFSTEFLEGALPIARGYLEENGGLRFDIFGFSGEGIQSIFSKAQIENKVRQFMAYIQELNKSVAELENVEVISADELIEED